VRHLPNGLETRVQERGENLSSGQKQLIAFARALAHGPQYLILDEATSNIDLETEARIREALVPLLRGKTSVVIAHRLSTILTADRILVMHKGRIAETGNHQALMAQRGLYWRLYQIQFGLQSETDRHSAHILQPLSQ
jgi:ATP-binding cassette subfamily B protein